MTAERDVQKNPAQTAEDAALMEEVSEVDLQSLAEEVFKLLKRELQLEKERLGR